MKPTEPLNRADKLMEEYGDLINDIPHLQPGYGYPSTQKSCKGGSKIGVNSPILKE
jgi:hypothetical protein